MLGYYYILFVFALMVIDAEGKGLEKCMELFNGGMMKTGACCLDLKDFSGVGNPECRVLKSPCEMINCEFTKHGAKIENDKFDDESALIAMKKLAKDNPQIKDMNERSIKFCLDGKYKKYGPPDTCDVMKLHICSSINSIVGCKNWKKDEYCQKIESDAMECKRTLDDFNN